MRILLVLLRKEFKQIFRDKFILVIMFQMPVIQLLIMPLAATYEMKNISLCVVDNDHSTYSQKLIQAFTASGYFQLTDYASSHNQALESIEKNKADLILEIPNHFERTLVTENKAQLSLNLNAINGSTAGLAGNYASAIIKKFNAEIRETFVQNGKMNAAPIIDITYSNWYNETLNYPRFMVPGILAILLTLVGAFLTALNIVSEKEKGTIEQINVTPVKKSTFIISKLIPFWVIGMVIFTIGLAICRFVYGIIPLGSYATIYGFGMVYMVSVLGLGLLISTYSENQQQAMFIAFFFMIICILLGGEFTPITTMPHWAQIVTRFNPISYFIEVLRLVMIKGSSFKDVMYQFYAICAFSFVFNFWAILNYRKTN